jgi:hypothetical protein
MVVTHYTTSRNEEVAGRKSEKENIIMGKQNGLKVVHVIP